MYKYTKDRDCPLSKDNGLVELCINSTFCHKLRFYIFEKLLRHPFMVLFLVLESLEQFSVKFIGQIFIVTYYLLYY